MSVTATCGHVLSEEEGLGTNVSIKDYCKDGSRAVGYPTLCTRCLGEHIEQGRILATDKERRNWLNGTTKD